MKRNKIPPQSGLTSVKGRKGSRKKKGRNNRAASFDTLLLTFLSVVFIFMIGIYYFHFSTIIMNTSKANKDNKIDHDIPNLRKNSIEESEHEQNEKMYSADELGQILGPNVPVLPIFPEIPEADYFIDELINEKNPKMAGIIAYIQRFLSKLHKQHLELASEKAASIKIIRSFFDLASKHLLPLDEAYRGVTMFPVRDDGSIFMSVAAFREHLLKETLTGAFNNAKSPDKLFIGAVVQNCFGRVDEVTGEIDSSGMSCRTGAQVIGKNKKGRDMTKVSDAPPDKNGIEDFCTDPQYKKYCDNGQIRVIYVHETESLGPAMARYYASKLWGGETYFMQSDSHLLFAKHWDQKYIDEAIATKNYPKSVLSSYPPGFSTVQSTIVESAGTKLCSCEFSTNAIEQNIIRINSGAGYSGFEKQPTQIPFIAAGFFFAHAEFLVDVPFDPLMPWCFMGEEIALSMRAWTSGWNIYAPRKNLIHHQYRPGRMGLPKFWGTVNRLFTKGPSSNNNLQEVVIDRVRHLVGYPEISEQVLQNADHLFLLKDQQYYGMGKERTLDEYFEWTGIDMEKKNCPRMRWCNTGQYT